MSIGFILERLLQIFSSNEYILQMHAYFSVSGIGLESRSGDRVLFLNTRTNIAESIIEG